MDTAAPFGMRPVFHPTGLDRAHRFLNAIPSGYATNIFKFQPVALNTSGQIVAAAASGADYLGVFAGVMYIDALQKPTFSNNWVASTTLGTGDQWVFVWDDPKIVYEVQANGSIAQTAIGDQADFAASMATGSALTGLSTGAISSALVGAGAQGMVRIVDLQPRSDNAWGDAFTIVQVQMARHQYVSNKVAI